MNICHSGFHQEHAHGRARHFCEMCNIPWLRFAPGTYQLFWEWQHALHKNLGSRPHAHGRRSKSTTCTAGPFTQAHVPRGFPSKLAAYARWMEQANKAVQRWKNRSWVERRRTLGTERDLYQAKFLKNMTALGLHRPATSNANNGTWSR